MAKPITYQAIGVIRSPFQESKGMPIQSRYSDSKGHIELQAKFSKACFGLDKMEYIILLYHFDRAKSWKAVVKPFLSEQEQGLFAIRAPNRPNPIGLSVVKLLSITEKQDHIRIDIQGVDVLDKTPLLDIKPYIPDFDAIPEAKAGWYDNKNIRKKKTKADDRFSTV